MPKRLGPKRLGPKRLGAETSRGRNGLVPPKRLVTDIFFFFFANCIEMPNVQTLDPLGLLCCEFIINYTTAEHQLVYSLLP